MEKLQGPINPCLFQRCLEEQKTSCYQLLTSQEEEEEAFRYTFEEYSNEQLHQTPQYTLPKLEDKMPFLQMLQSVEDCTSFLHEPNFQLLLRLQDQEDQNRKKTPWNTSNYELESCVTNEIVNLSSECNQMQTQMEKPPPVQKKKRKRISKMSKNKEEVETQRMTHIAVERNRRRQMNDHLNALRSLMPSSYVQRGDQASIIGGAIDFVKELEQMLRSLQAQKRMRHSELDSNGDVSTGSSNPLQLNNNNVLHPENDGTSSSAELQEAAAGVRKGDEFKAENRSQEADVDAVVIQNHVNLKIQCQKRPRGQLVRAILALEDLRLTVLHLNITSMETSVHYSFNLKIEDECNLRTAAEIAGAVLQIFSHNSILEN